MKILVVDDEKLLVKGLKFNLENEGYEVQTAYDGAAAVELVRREEFDLVLLDWMMPGVTGVEACSRLRHEGYEKAILMLTARDSVEDRVTGLDAGADDYLVKPFEFAELLARLRVALRRVNAEASAGAESAVYENGGLRIDYAAGCAYIADREIHLTPIEYRLLCLLARNTGKVLTHNYILKEIRGSYTASDVGSLRVFMATPSFLRDDCG